MKRRIARLEGNAKTTKQLEGTLEKHVKILEAALKKERERVKSLINGEKIDLHKDAKELAREELKSLSKDTLDSLS
jgi:striatin 1/3/4